MKKVIATVLILFLSTSIIGCNKQVTSIPTTTTEQEQNKIPEPYTPELKPEPIPPVITENEKAIKLADMVQKYIDNGGNANYSIDEFNSSVMATFPDNDKLAIVRLKGDNNEDILLSGMISQSTEGNGASFLLMLYYIIHDGSPIEPKNLYVKVDSETLTMSNIIRTDYDIGLGYISEMSNKLYTESDYNELLELRRILEKGEVRIRISGSGGNVDFTFPKKNGQLLIDSIDLFDKFNN